MPRRYGGSRAQYRAYRTVAPRAVRQGGEKRGWDTYGVAGGNCCGLAVMEELNKIAPSLKHNIAVAGG